jgi:isopentenyl-diphosphate delta-isomerase
MDVILVNENDVALGSMEKMEAHRQGLLHRAFSIFVFNDNGDVMLHRRAREKYHSGGLWTNTCCSHPLMGETVMEAANRRLQEEMGFQCKLKEEFSFIYKAELDNDLTEHEYDHVLTGIYNDEPVINPDEVWEWKWFSRKELQEKLTAEPEMFTEWFLIAYPELLKNLEVS